jgi:hypothetical protein
MANPWFRMYQVFATDHKVQMLSEADQRRLVMLFCFRCNGDETLHDDAIAFQLRVSSEEWQETKRRFIEQGFIDESNLILNWNKRQFQSDTSTSRVNAYRERKKQQGNGNETFQKQKSNAVDTDTDSYTDKPKTIVRKSSARFTEFWLAWPKSPRKVDKAKCEKKWAALKLDAIADQIIQHVIAISKTKQWIDGFEPAPMTYLNGGRWADEIFTGEGATQSNTKPWYISSTGIEAKAKELGIVQDRDEVFPAFKVRVYKAAGITPEMVRTANEDFAQRK